MNRMPLPDLIEILPITRPVTARITVPGSKSVTNRALILSVLSHGVTDLEGALWSDDTQIMVDCLRRLGFKIEVFADPDERANRLLRIQGLDGRVPNGGTHERPLELFVGNAGTVARFLCPLVCLGHGVYRLSGVSRMSERPQAALLEALTRLGYSTQSPNGKLPALIHGAGPRPGTCSVDMEQSSQFVSALLLSSKIGQWDIRWTSRHSAPYVTMTQELIKAFGQCRGRFQIEPDASSGSYFWAAGWLQNQGYPGRPSQVEVAHWPQSGWQIDAAFPDKLPLPSTLSRIKHLGDSILTAIAIAPFQERPTRFTDLGRLRLQECERVEAMRTELSRCGAKVQEKGDCLTISPSSMTGAEVQTYDDHRIAMSLSIIGLKTPGMRIRNPACVNKTFPSFFQKLAAPPPSGLGVTLLDPRTRRALTQEHLNS